MCERIAYLELMREQASLGACPVHAYVPMANGVHPLLTPARASCARWRGITNRCRRRGVDERLWERDFEAVPVYARRHVLGCMRYTKLNAGRAGLLARPEAYRYSSHRADALSEDDALLSPHTLNCALRGSPEEHRAAYRAQFRRA